MSFKEIKKTPFLLSMSVAALSGISFIPRANAAQLNFQSPSEAIEGSEFAVPFDSTLEESGLIESSSQDSELAGFSCDFAPEGSNSEVQPDADILSHLGPNLVAQAGPFDIGQFSPVEQGPIIGEMCEIEGAPIGGVGGGFPYPALSALALGLIPLLSGPEPVATPFVFAALGLGGVIARKRLNGSDNDEA